MTVASGKSTGTVTITPSGIPVYFQSEPKRLYRLGSVEFGNEPDEDLLKDAQAEGPSWREVPSVTTVLGVLDKPALPWWGMRVGVEGVIVLHNLGLVWSEPFGGQKVLVCKDASNMTVVAGVPQIEELLKKHLLTVNHVKSRAGDRGQAVHDALELWAKDGTLPDPDMFPETERGYIEGLLAFFADVDPEPEGVEVLVASAEHGFAGRYDVRLRFTKECDVIVHRTPKRGPQYRRMPAGTTVLADLKSSSGTYPTHALQLAAYELASIESGYSPTDAQAVLHVSATGEYEFKRSKAVAEDFVAIRVAYETMQNGKDWLR